MSTSDKTPQSAADFTLDLRGESCPYPVVHSLEALGSVKRGQRIAVTTDCPQSFRNIPEQLPEHGHRIIGEPTRDGAEMTFVIESGGKQKHRR